MSCREYINFPNFANFEEIREAKIFWVEPGNFSYDEEIPRNKIKFDNNFNIYISGMLVNVDGQETKKRRAFFCQP